LGRGTIRRAATATDYGGPRRQTTQRADDGEAEQTRRARRGRGSRRLCGDQQEDVRRIRSSRDPRGTMWKTASASPGRTTPASRRRPRHPQRTLHACTQRSQGRGDLLHFTHLPIEVSALFMYFEHRQGPRTHMCMHMCGSAPGHRVPVWAGIGCGPDIDLYRPAPWSEGFVALRSIKADCM